MTKCLYCHKNQVNSNGDDLCLDCLKLPSYQYSKNGVIITKYAGIEIDGRNFDSNYITLSKQILCDVSILNKEYNNKKWWEFWK